MPLRHSRESLRHWQPFRHCWKPLGQWCWSCRYWQSCRHHWQPLRYYGLPLWCHLKPLGHHWHLFRHSQPLWHHWKPLREEIIHREESRGLSWPESLALVLGCLGGTGGSCGETAELTSSAILCWLGRHRRWWGKGRARGGNCACRRGTGPLGWEGGRG